MRSPKELRERQLIDEWMALDFTARMEREHGEIEEAEKTEKRIEEIKQELDALNVK